MRPILLIGILLFAIGCDQSQWRFVPVPPESPIANVPTKLRQKNWVDRAGSGSCVIASSCSLLRWHNQDQIADYFRRAYAGGQTARSIKDIWNQHKIPFEQEEHGRPEFLDWCSNTRRPAIIWFFDSHCVTFCGFGMHQGRQVAWLLDNNRVERFIPIERNAFIRAWRGYGGFAMATTLEPCPPLPAQGYEVIQ